MKVLLKTSDRAETVIKFLTSRYKQNINLFAQRLQVQERLTEQIASSLQEYLNPSGSQRYYTSQTFMYDDAGN
ncbi:GTP cyclohydrolase I [Brevibacillus laterosporus]|uniref:GTP cyclohydrolase I n=1 Tax=Brevibacillus laterosporus TaxID=1465 RepID=UPI0022792727|nr:GTP cyclohydrolase I [Brevibacillus laterosporus]